MKTYWVKCRKDTNNINPKIFKTKKNYLCNQHLAIARIKSHDW